MTNIVRGEKKPNRTVIGIKVAPMKAWGYMSGTVEWE